MSNSYEQTKKLNTWEEVAEYLSTVELTAEFVNNVIRASKHASFDDALSKGQLASKAWILHTARRINDAVYEDVEDAPLILVDQKIIICGGWFGTLAAMILQQVDVLRITSVDIDPGCKRIAETLNCNAVSVGKFFASTDNMYTYNYHPYSTIINTSYEHLRAPYIWKNALRQTPDKYIIVQSNNNNNIRDHVNCHTSHEALAKDMNFDRLYYEGTLTLPDYERYMVIGKYK